MYNYHNLQDTVTWTQEEITSIQDVFSSEVHGRFVDIESVRMKLPPLKTHAMDKQILDKVRSLFRYTPIKKKPIATSVSTVFLESVIY